MQLTVIVYVELCEKKWQWKELIGCVISDFEPLIWALFLPLIKLLLLMLLLRPRLYIREWRWKELIGFVTSDFEALV